MILTYKVKHNRDLSVELRKARQIAEFALKTKTRSSKDVKHFGLKSAIANQILRKYSRNKNLKRIGNVKLAVPNQSLHVEGEMLKIPCLKLSLPVTFRRDFSKINQIELDASYAYVSVTIPESPLKQVSNWIGVDRNATSHVAVVANPVSGKVWKLGKDPAHSPQIPCHQKEVAGSRQIQEGQINQEPRIQNYERYQPQNRKGDCWYRRTGGLWNQVGKAWRNQEEQAAWRELQRSAPFVVVPSTSRLHSIQGSFERYSDCLRRAEKHIERVFSVWKRRNKNRKGLRVPVRAR